MCMRLHERLRLARERRGLSLSGIARQWGVREHNLALIERDAFEELPTGLYGRNAVRAYATAVGVPADEAIAEVADRIRVPEDPLDGLARVRGIFRQPARQSGEALPVHPKAIASRDTWRPLAATTIDGAVLLGINLAVIGLTALAAGARPTDVLRIAAPAMVLLGAVIAAVYFILLGGIRCATIGARIARVRSQPPALDGADVHAVIQRSLHCALAEGSSLVTFIASTESAWHWVRTLRERRA
jgi:hypothetical protein